MEILNSLAKAPFRSQPPAPVVSVEAASAPEVVASDGVDLERDQPVKEWTVLVYANGKTNGADRFVGSVMRELEVAGSDANMDIVAQVGRKDRIYDQVTKDWSGVRRYHVERNPDPLPLSKEIQKWFLPPYTSGIVSPVLEDLGNADMGSSASLSEFLQWGMKEYPAKNYAVVMYGEGGGFSGVGLDEKTGQKTNYKGLAQAIRDGEEASGGDVKLVAIDGSFGANIEGAHELKDVADILVGSQAAVKLGSLQLDQIMKDLKFELAEKGEVSAQTLARWFVFETQAQPGPLAAIVNPTLSAIDLKKIDATTAAYTQLAAELSKAMAANPMAKAALRQAIAETQNYHLDSDSSGFYGDFRDIGHFAKNLQSDARLGQGVHQAAAALGQASADSVIDEVHTGPAVAESTGLSGYLPLDAGYDLHSSWKSPLDFDPLHGYRETSVGHDSQWVDVLKNISNEEKPNARLRGWGLGNTGIVRVNKTLAVLQQAAKWAFGFTSKAGSYQAYKFARGKEPGRYFFLPPGITVPLGVVGGARTAFLSGKQVVKAIGDDSLKNKAQAIIDGSLGTISGLGVGTAAVGHLFKDAAFLKRPAAITAVGASVGKQVYGVVATVAAQVRVKEAANALTPTQRVAQVALRGAGEQNYFLPPVVRWLSEIGSPGNLDPSRVIG